MNSMDIQGQRSRLKRHLCIFVRSAICPDCDVSPDHPALQWASSVLIKLYLSIMLWMFIMLKRLLSIVAWYSLSGYNGFIGLKSCEDYLYQAMCGTFFGRFKLFGENF